MLVRQQPSVGSEKLRWGTLSAHLHFLQLQEGCLIKAFCMFTSLKVWNHPTSVCTLTRS